MINYESELAATIRNCDFQKLQDEMAKATKLACITVDYTGAPVTAHSCCTDFCALVRNHPEYKHLCEKCDSRGGLEAARNKNRTHTFVIWASSTLRSPLFIRIFTSARSCAVRFYCPRRTKRISRKSFPKKRGRLRRKRKSLLR